MATKLSEIDIDPLNREQLTKLLGRWAFALNEAAKKEESEIKKEMARIRKEMEDERKKHEEQKLRSVEILIEFRYGFQHLCFTSV